MNRTLAAGTGREIVRAAPAKLNLTLEITGKRPDGYHNVSSVVCALSMWDTLRVTNGAGFLIEATEDYDATGLGLHGRDLNTVETAIALMVIEQARIAHRRLPTFEEALRVGVGHAAIRLTKRIPAAAGLGGGSSDGVAALTALAEFWSLELDGSSIGRMALMIGSDCPFFLQAGAQLMKGRGEVLETLPPPNAFWCCLLVPPLRRSAKTAYIYGLLREAQFSSGQASAEVAAHLRRRPNAEIEPDCLFNVFDAVSDRAFGDLSSYRRALLEAGARAVHLCGSGPTLYGFFDGEASARRAETILHCQGYSAYAVCCGAVISDRLVE